MILAQEQDELGGKFSALESFRGRMARMNLWNITLGPSTAAALMGSCSDARGSVFSWGDALLGTSAFLRPSPLSACAACAAPAAPARGSLAQVRRGQDGSQSGAGAEVRFRCEEGFMLDSAAGRGAEDEGEGDDGARRCGVLGEWDRPLPNCVGMNTE